MIDERELLEWAESAKKLSKMDCIVSDGKFYYAVSFVDLRAKIRALSGISESEVMQYGEEAQDRQKKIQL